MREAARYWRWIPFAVGVGIPTAYFLGRQGDILYLDGFMGNWLATELCQRLGRVGDQQSIRHADHVTKLWGTQV